MNQVKHTFRPQESLWRPEQFDARFPRGAGGAAVSGSGSELRALDVDDS